MKAQQIINELIEKFSEWEEVVGGNQYPYLLLQVLANQLIKEKELLASERNEHSRLKAYMVKYATRVN